MKNIFLTGLFAFTFLFASCEDSSETDLDNNEGNEEIVEESNTNVDKFVPFKGKCNFIRNGSVLLHSKIWVS